MKKIKRVNKLNKVITKELKPFGIRKATMSNEYAYYFNDSHITYTLIETINDEWFNEFVKERFNLSDTESFVLSLLHEVGHHKANSNIDGDIYDFCMKEKKRLEKCIKKSDCTEEIKKLNWEYFNLPDEIMATQWAVNYIKRHPKKVEKMWDNIYKELLKFYKKNYVKG